MSTTCMTASPKPRETGKELTLTEKLVVESYRRGQAWLQRLMVLWIAWFRDFSISLAVHIAIIAVLSGVIAYRYVETKRTFKASVRPSLAPRDASASRLAHSAQLRKSAQLTRMPLHLTERTVTTIAANRPAEDLQAALPPVPMPNYDLNPVGSNMGNKFGATGMGTQDGLGLADVGGPGGMGSGSGDINFFGIRDKGERVALLVDISTSMVDPRKGGYEGYTRVKAELMRIVNELPEKVSFNLFLFGSQVFCMDLKGLVRATPEAKKKASEFLQPFYDPQNPGSLETSDELDYADHVYHPDEDRLPQGGGTRVDIAMLAAFHQNPDTIFIISDGAPNVGGVYSEGHLLHPPLSASEVMNKILGWKRTIYLGHRSSEPRVHVVSYEADSAGNSFLQSLAGRNSGKYVRIRGFGSMVHAIKSDQGSTPSP